MHSVRVSYAEQRISSPRPVAPLSACGARRLGCAYWAEVERFCRGLVRARECGGGRELRLTGLVPLLRFGPPTTSVHEDGLECRYPIEGGLLAAGPGGFLVLAQRGTAPTVVSVAVEDYRARLAMGGWMGLRRRLFAAIQAPLHERIGRRFLERVAQGRL